MSLVRRGHISGSLGFMECALGQQIIQMVKETNIPTVKIGERIANFTVIQAKKCSKHLYSISVLPLVAGYMVRNGNYLTTALKCNGFIERHQYYCSTFLWILKPVACVGAPGENDG